VTVDFEGTIEGIPFEGGSANGHTFVLGEARMLDEFEAALQGMQPGESKTFNVTFPADYHGKDVAGKTAQFKLTLQAVEWPHLPEIDAAFAQSLGIEDGDLAKMRADVHANLQREIKKRLFARTKDHVMDALLKVAELEVPKALVEGEAARLMEATRQDLRGRGMKVDDVPFPPELFQAQAERRVRLGLIVADLVKTQSLAAQPEQIKSHVEDLARSYENPTEVVRWYYSERKRLGEVEALVLEENVVNYVIGQVRTKVTPVAFDDLMGNAST
jgi:trigger factor